MHPQLGAGDPSRLGGYRLLARLGAGGMGQMYLVRSPGGRTVVLEVVRPELTTDRGVRARFRREVDAARRVSGADTAPVVDADPDAEVPWLATAYVPGPAPADAVADHGPLPEHTVRTLAAALAEALTVVHAGLVHRDLRPSTHVPPLPGPPPPRSAPGPAPGSAPRSVPGSARGSVPASTPPRSGRHDGRLTAGWGETR